MFLGGYLVNSILTSALLALLVTGLGWSVYGVVVPSPHVLAIVATVLVGALACCALGFAVTIVVRRVNTAEALIPAISLTLFFLSGNFFNTDGAPAAFRDVAGVFPVRHLYNAMLTAFNANVSGNGFALGDLGIVALWGVAALAVAAFKFRWSPSAEG
jgi:ABC-2 type transport system permease protein